MKEDVKEKYARLLLSIGCDLRPGEILLIQADPEEAEFVRILTRAAYLRGARYVQADFRDVALAEIRCVHSREEYLSDFPAWNIQYEVQRARDKIAVVRLLSPMKQGESPLPAHRWQKMHFAEMCALEEYRAARTDGHISGVTACLPSRKWARKVYPELEEDAALQQLWSDFAYVLRLDQNDPVDAWEQHRKQLATRKERLDQLRISKLKLCGPGTDLTIGMVLDGSWTGGGERNLRTGGLYTPNIPTEELFAVPHKYQTEGVVRATLPLNYAGRLIEDFQLRFSHGEVTQWTARSGEEHLDRILHADEGARRLGEAALVSVESPIYQTGRIFYNTIFDENAVCHLALGQASLSSICGGMEMSARERDRAGINESGVHVDFMVGSQYLDVYAETIQGDICLMRGGQWTF